MNSPNRASRNQAIRWSRSAADSAAWETMGAIPRANTGKRSDASMSLDIFINGVWLSQSLPGQCMAQSAVLAKPEWENGWKRGGCGYYRRARWSQIRNPKLETRNKFKCQMVQGQEPPTGQWVCSFPARSAEHTSDI